jgi:rhodanese-related sulfurtransferase
MMALSNLESRPDLESRNIDPATVRQWYADDAEFALVDVREEADFSEKSIFFAAPLPLSRLELRAASLLPRRSVRVVVTDEAGEFSALAASRLASLGYDDVHVLAGGIAAWEAAGLPVYSGVHVPSKAFAEVVEEHFHTPWIDVPELARLLESDEDFVVVDSRTPSEFVRAAVPGAICVPGADLVRNIRDIAPNAETLVVVNCGGRTRSIIGAQALINAGLPNKVVSLKDGLLSWRLHGLVPEQGNERGSPPLSAAAAQWGASAAREVAAREGVRSITLAAVRALAAQRDTTVHLFDVRSAEEYAAGHLPGSVSAPGGQLVQETDSYVAVHGAHVVLVGDDDGTRAAMTAAWLSQMGLANVFLLEGGLGDHPLETGPRPPLVLGLQAAARDPRRAITPADLAALLDGEGATVVDVDLAQHHKAAHIPGAWLARRTELAAHLADLPAQRPLVLTSKDGILARLAAADLAEDTLWLEGGTDAWAAQGLPLATEIEHAIGGGGRDVWLSPTQRGDLHAAAREYLAWELDLARMVHNDTDVRFKLPTLSVDGN